MSTMQESGHTPDWQGQAVERVLSNGKRIFSSAFKRWLVEQASRPGVSVAGLALRFSVNANQLRRWIKLDAQVQTHSPAILPVTLVQPGAHAVCMAPLPRAPIEVEIGGALVRVHEGTDAGHLRMVFDLLRA